jgi:tRNA(Ile)-lysidine synthase
MAKKHSLGDLKAKALHLAQLIPKDKLHRSVLAWADACSKKEVWSVAFSSGADSLALLLLIWAYWPEKRKQIVALHFDHRLRGAASLKDEAFAKQVALALSIKFKSDFWKSPPDKPSEALAREARFNFFKKVMPKVKSNSLWLGHQQDDIAETFFMRLARGSGTAGLAAPRPFYTESNFAVILRPLLTLKKEEIKSALTLAQVPWREDRSNAAYTYFRNRIRLSVIPAWIEASNRDALRGAAYSRTLLEEDDDAINQWVISLNCLSPTGKLNLSRITGKPKAICRRALYLWLNKQTQVGRLSARGFETLLAAVIAGKPTKQSLGPHGFAVINTQWLFFHK